AGNADGEPVVFARNQLVIAVDAGNPLGIKGLEDLTEPGVTVALCAEQVPCGAAAKTAIEASGLTIMPVSFEENVRAALSKVSLGEVDAALVYRTDASIDDTVEAVEFPESAEAINDYTIVVLSDAPNKPGAEAFVAYVRSPDGTAVLTAYGFQQPQAPHAQRRAFRRPPLIHRWPPKLHSGSKADPQADRAPRARATGVTGGAGAGVPGAAPSGVARSRAVADSPAAAGRVRGARGAAAVASRRDAGHRRLPGPRRAAGLAARPGRLPRSAAGPGAGHRAARPPASGRRLGVVAAARPARAHRPM